MQEDSSKSNLVAVFNCLGHNLAESLQQKDNSCLQILHSLVQSEQPGVNGIVRLIVDNAFMHICSQSEDQQLIKSELAKVNMLFNISYLKKVPDSHVSMEKTHRLLESQLSDLNSPWGNCKACEKLCREILTDRAERSVCASISAIRRSVVSMYSPASEVERENTRLRQAVNVTISLERLASLSQYEIVFWGLNVIMGLSGIKFDMIGPNVVGALLAPMRNDHRWKLLTDLASCPYPLVPSILVVRTTSVITDLIKREQEMPMDDVLFNLVACTAYQLTSTNTKIRRAGISAGKALLDSKCLSAAAVTLVRSLLRLEEEIMYDSETAFTKLDSVLCQKDKQHMINMFNSLYTLSSSEPALASNMLKILQCCPGSSCLPEIWKIVEMLLILDNSRWNEEHGKLLEVCLDHVRVVSEQFVTQKLDKKTDRKLSDSLRYYIVSIWASCLHALDTISEADNEISRGVANTLLQKLDEWIWLVSSVTPLETLSRRGNGDQINGNGTAANLLEDTVIASKSYQFVQGKDGKHVSDLFVIKLLELHTRHSISGIVETCAQYFTQFPVSGDVFATVLEWWQMESTYTLSRAFLTEISVFSELLSACIDSRLEQDKKPELNSWCDQVAKIEGKPHLVAGLKDPEKLIRRLFAVLKLQLNSVEELKSNGDADERIGDVEYCSHLLVSNIQELTDMIVASETKLSAEELVDVFDIETAVKCVESDYGPSVRNTGLMLLSSLASVLPSEVLGHIMTVLRNFGSRRDDVSTFSMLQRSLELIVPAVVKFGPASGIHLEDFIKLFVVTILEIPSHRREPLMTSLVQNIWKAEGKNKYSMEEEDGSQAKKKQHQREVMDRTKAEVITSTISMLLARKAAAHDDDVKEAIDVLVHSVWNQNLSVLAQLEASSLLLSTIMMLYGTRTDASKENEEEDAVFVRKWIGHVKDLKGSDCLDMHLLDFVVHAFSNTEFLKKLKSVPEGSSHFDEIQIRQLGIAQKIFQLLRICQESQKDADYRGRYILRVLERLTACLSVSGFVAVIHTLLQHEDPYIRRRSLSFLNARIIRQREGRTLDDDNMGELFIGASAASVQALEDLRNVHISEDEMLLYLDLLPDLCQILEDEKESWINKQTAVLSIDVLLSHFGKLRGKSFKRAISGLAKFISGTIEEVVLGFPDANMSTESTALIQCFASAILTFGHACSTSEVLVIPHIPQSIPTFWQVLEALIEDMKKGKSSPANDKAASSFTLLQAILTVANALCHRLSRFLSSQLSRLIRILLDPTILKHPVNDIRSTCTEAFQGLCSTCPPRVCLLPLINSYSDVSKKSAESTAMLADGIRTKLSYMSNKEITARSTYLFELIFRAFDFRWLRGRWVEMDTISITTVEDKFVRCCVELMLKLTESQLRPLFLKLLQWRCAPDEDLETSAERDCFFQRDGRHDSQFDQEDSLTRESYWCFASLCRRITFYRVVEVMSSQAKSIFVPFFGYFMQDMMIELAELGGAGFTDGVFTKKRKTVHDKGDRDDSESDDRSSESEGDHDQGHREPSHGMSNEMVASNAAVRHHRTEAKHKSVQLEQPAIPTIHNQLPLAEVSSVPSCQHSLRCLIVSCLYQCCMHDVDGFVDDDKLEVVLKPLSSVFELPVSDAQEKTKTKKRKRVERESPSSAIQNERIQGAVPVPGSADGGNGYRLFVEKYLVPCFVELCKALGKDTRWKRVNHYLLILARDSQLRVRTAALLTAYQIFDSMSDEILMLLPETLPILGEIMERDDEEEVQLAKRFIRLLESRSGESLNDYLTS